MNSVDFHYLILIVMQGSRCQIFCKILVRKLLYCIKYYIEVIIFYQGIVSRGSFLCILLIFNFIFSIIIIAIICTDYLCMKLYILIVIAIISVLF